MVYVSLLSGCKDSEPEDIDRDLRIYNLNFVFEDKDGNNLVEKIEAGTNQSGNIYNIDPYAYKMTLTMGDRTITTPKYDLLGLGKSENGNFLSWTEVTLEQPLYKKIEMTLSFKQIFGNTDIHTIISDWEQPDILNRPECKKVTFDGKEYPVTYNKDMRCDLVIITVDNQK